MTTAGPVERCAKCGWFYPAPADKHHSPEYCAANDLGALPTREPSPHKRAKAKLPNKPVDFGVK